MAVRIRRWFFLYVATIIFNLTVISLEMRTCTDGALRLTGGPNEFEGRVEICFGGEWGQVCGDRGWEGQQSLATITCRHLGYIPDGPTRPQGSPRHAHMYESGNGPAFLNINTDPRCGNPQVVQSLLNCTSYSEINSTSGCPNDTTPMAVGCPDIQCKPNEIKVVDAMDSSGGKRLEVCLEFPVMKLRAGICSQNWDNSDAEVLCKQLQENSTTDLDAAQAISGPISNNYGALLNSSIDCIGNETDFAECLTISVHTLVFNNEVGCSLAEVQCPSAAEPSPTTAPTSTTSSSFTTSTKPEPSPETTAPKYTLIAIVVGIVVLVVLVLIVVLLIVLIFLATKKYSRKKHHYEARSMENSYSSSDRPVSAEYDDTLPVVATTALTHSPTPEKSNDSASDEEPEKILINPLYTITNIPVQPSTGYTAMLFPDTPTHYAIPTPRILSPDLAHTTATNRGAVGSRGGPVTDAQGYAELEAPLVTSEPRPYETPQLSPLTSKQNVADKSDSQAQHVYDTVQDK